MFSAVRHVLNERLERPITAVEIQALLKRLGEDTRVARCARAKRQRPRPQQQQPRQPEHAPTFQFDRGRWSGERGKEPRGAVT